MRIRSGFVSNSSSTSFLIVTKEDLTLENFYKLVGVEPSSPIAGMFEELFEAIQEGVSREIDFSKPQSSGAVERFQRGSKLDMTANMRDRIEKAQKKGLRVLYGALDTESTPVESFFCMDSFELEGDGIYMDALSNVY